MVYKERFVVAVKCDGKILREYNDVVNLPFGSEYSILLKNLESRKAVVEVSVDGEDVLDGNSIIVHPNSETELEGFMKGSIVRNRFRFIEKTDEISDYRGDGVDDGIIRVEFKFERKEEVTIKRTTYYEDYHIPYRRGLYYNDPFTFYNSTSNYSLDNIQTNYCMSNDEGITVKGSETKQDFVKGYTRELEEGSNVITIKLKGFTSSKKKVKKLITVRTKLTCPTCGKKSKSDKKFCGNCGTYLL